MRLVSATDLGAQIEYVVDPEGDLELLSRFHPDGNGLISWRVSAPAPELFETVEEFDANRADQVAADTVALSDAVADQVEVAQEASAPIVLAEDEPI